MSPGYGKRVLSMPEGAIALNNNDTVVAGTNLGGGGNTSSPTVNFDTSKLEGLMEQNIAMNAEVAKRTGAESLWSKGNESLGNKANTDLKYGNIDKGFS